MAKSRNRKLADLIVTAGVDIAGNVTFDGGSTSADLTFADGDKANFGASSDLQVYHDGGNSYIKESGAGALVLQSAGPAIVLEKTDGENMLLANVDGAITLYYNGSNKLATTSTGINVTGITTSDTLVLEGTGVNTTYFTGGDASVSGRQLTLSSEAAGGQNNATHRLTVPSGYGSFNVTVNAKERVKINNNGDVSFYNDASSNAVKMFWDASAESLGLGTTTPGAKLHIEGDGKYATIRGYSQILDLGNWTNGEIRIESTGAPFHLRAAGNQPLHLETNNVERISILGTGNVGIGTTSPSAKLDIAGGHIFLDNAYGLFMGDGNTGMIGRGSADTDSYVGIRVNGGTDKITVKSTGNVGIGETSPDAKLHIMTSSNGASTVGSASDELILENSGDCGLTIRSGSSYDGVISFADADDHNVGQVYYSHDTNDMTFKTNDSIAMTLDDGGKLGIGETSPSKQLTVSGADAEFLLNRTGSYADTITMGMPGGVPTIVGGTDLAFGGTGSWTEHMRIKADGNVGIGTNNPGYKLEVAGTGHVSSTLSAGSIAIPSQGLTLNQAFGTGVPTVHFRGTTNNGRAGALYFQESDGSGGHANAAALYSTDGAGSNAAYGGLTIAAYQSDIRFSTGTLAGTKMIVKADGNVGIGVSSTYSGAKLSVAGSTVLANGNQFVIGTFGTSGLQLIGTAGGDNVVGTMGSSEPLLFRTASSERMRIDANGNLGFGVTPNANWSSSYRAIDAFGGATFQFEANSTRQGQNFYGYPWKYKSTRTASSIAHTSGGDISFQVAPSGTADSAITWSQAMLIKNGGNVGIGTNSPGAKLEISGKDDAGASDLLRLQFDNSPADTGITLTDINSTVKSRITIDSSNTNDLRISSATKIHLYGGTTNGTTSPHLTVSNSGNVGIGTTSPGSTLDVAGTTKITSSTSMLLTLNPTANNYGGIAFQYGGVTKGTSIFNSGMMVYGGESSVSTALQAGGQYGLFIHHSTRAVGIGTGTTSPVAKLEIRGSGGGTELSLKTTDASANETFFVQDGGRVGVRYWPFSVGIPSTTAVATNAAFQVEESGLLTVLTTGNVGIGTTGPSAKLTITDENAGQPMLQVRNFATSATGSFGNAHSVELRSASSTTTHGVLIHHHENNIGRRSLEVADANGVFATFVQGKVGIGTASPNLKLHVEESGDTWAGEFKNVRSAGGYGLRVDMTAGSSATDTRYAFAVYTPGNSGLFVRNNGNVGIGTTAPSSGLHISRAPNGGNPTTHIYQSGATNAPTLKIQQAGNGGNPNVTQGLLIEIDGTNDGSSNLIRAVGKNSNVNSGNDVNAFVVKNGGHVGIGVTAAPSGSTGGFWFSTDQFYTSTTSTVTNYQIRMYNGNGLVGSIVTNGSATAFNTSSDYRLKENVDYTWDATTRLKQLKPARFNFIVDDTNTLVDGFLAHEVEDIVPEAVTGEKDGEEMQSIDQSKLVPLLVKTIQELEARIAALEA